MISYNKTNSYKLNRKRNNTKSHSFYESKYAFYTYTFLAIKFYKDMIMFMKLYDEKYTKTSVLKV